MIYSFFRKQCVIVGIIFGLFIQVGGFAQEILTGLYKNEVIENAYKKSLKNKQRKSTLFIYYEPILIPFIEDFSNYTGYPDTALWIGNQAYVNQSFAVNPPTIGVVTLDAVDEKGRIYEHATKTPQTFGADTLLSKPIRLDSIFSPIPRELTVADDISFCFLYQPGGGDDTTWVNLGDAPEPYDSLVLEFGYQTGNVAFLYYTTEWGYLTDSIPAGSTIYSHCDPNLFIIADRDYFPGDSVLMPCDSVTTLETVWEHIWSTPGMNLKTFKKLYGVYFRQVCIPIVDKKFFNCGFQFRFRNYASLEYENNEPYWASNVDFWNIDYIRLDSKQDTAINDVAFVENPGSILKNYTAMPWNQFKGYEDKELRDTFRLQNSLILPNYGIYDTVSKIKLSNLHNTLKNTVYYYDVFDNDGNIIGQYNGKTQNSYPFYQRGYQFEIAHAIPPVEQINFPNTNSDSVEILIQHVFREEGVGVNRNLKNDTAVFHQKFFNYYAYDDGTPEAGYFVFSLNNAALAIEFTLNKPDTLRAIDIYVNHTFNDVSNFDFILSVWNDTINKDGDTVPGRELYKSSVKQNFNDELYGFQRFFLNEPKVVTGKFYIGYQTTSGKVLNVGFDQNNNNIQHVFWKTTGNWSKSFLAGTPMLRPVLGKYFNPVSICEKEKKTEWEVKLYPNPAKEKLYIETSQEMQQKNIMLSIYSVVGQKIYEGTYTPEISLSDYASGFYLLRLSDSENHSVVRKFMISR